MPRLLAFLPCEKVVISQDDNSPNLFGILSGFHLKATMVPTDEEPGTLPLRWSTFTFWYKEPEDEGRTYEQRVDLVSPTGKVLFSQTAEFVMTKQRHRQTGTIFGFPTAGVGTYILRLSLRHVAQGQEFHTQAEFPVPIEIELVTESALPSTDSPSSTKVS